MQSSHSRTWHAVVAVRVPRDSSRALATEASSRLAARDGIDTVEIASVRGVEPALAATVVTLAVTVETTTAVDADALRCDLNAAPGCQRVDSVTPD